MPTIIGAILITFAEDKTPHLDVINVTEKRASEMPITIYYNKKVA